MFRQCALFAVCLALIQVSTQSPSGMEEPIPGLHGEEDMSSQELLKMLMSEHMEEKKEVKMDEDGCKSDETWKWLPPLPCRVVDANNVTDVIHERSCNMDLQCNVGPIDTMLNNTSVKMYHCALPGKYLLYHACRIQNMDTGVVIKEQTCPFGGECTLGALYVNSNGTNAMAYYCDSIKEITPEMLETREDSVVARACKVEDKEGYDQVARECPKGYKCTHGPIETIFRNESLTAMMCEKQEEEEEWEWSLKDTIEYMVMKLHVDPYNILKVMHLMKEKDVEITAKRVHDVVMAYKKMEQAKEEQEEGKGDNVEEIMKHLLQMHLMGNEAEKKEEEDSDPMAMVLKAMMDLKEKKEEKEEKEEKKDMLHTVMEAMMELKEKKEEAEEQDEKKDMLAKVMKMMMEMKEKKEEAEEQDEEKDMLAKVMKMMMEMHEKKEEAEEQDENKDMLAKVMKMMMEMHEKKEAAEEQDENKDMLAKVMKMMMEMHEKKEAAEEQDENKDMLAKVMKMMMEMKEKKEEAEEKEGKQDMLAKVMKMMMGLKEKKEEEEEDGDMDFTLLKMMMGMKEENEDEEDNMLAKAMKMMKALHEEGEEEEEEDEGNMVEKVMRMVGFLKDVHKKVEMLKDCTDKSEDGKLKKAMKMLMFLKEKMSEYKILMKRGDNDEVKMKKAMKMFALIKKMMAMKEEKEEDNEDNEMTKVMKVMKMAKEMMEGKEERQEEEEEGKDMKEMVMKMLMAMKEKKEEQSEMGDGEKLMMFVKQMLGGEKVEDIMHRIHHLHMFSKEAEMRQKVEEEKKAKSVENKAEELLQYLHQAHMVRQQADMMNRMGGGMGYGMPQPMAPRWG